MTTPDPKTPILSDEDDVTVALGGTAILSETPENQVLIDEKIFNQANPTLTSLGIKLSNPISKNLRDFDEQTLYSISSIS